MSEVRASDVDTSKLRLQKELLQLRKAARVLRDPGTTTSWRSSMDSSRPPAALSSLSRKYNDLELSYEFHANASQSHAILSPQANHGSRSRGMNVLCNWRSANKLSSHRSGIVLSDKDVHVRSRERDNEVDDVSAFPVFVNGNLTDDSNGLGSKSDTYLAKYSRSLVFGCKNSRIFSPTRKRRPIKLVGSAAILSPHFRKHKVQQTSKLDKRDTSLAASDTNEGESSSWTETLNEIEDYCNSEDVRLLPEAAQENHSSPSSMFFCGNPHEDESYTYSTPALSNRSYNPHNNYNPSGSCDRTTISFNDKEEDDGLTGFPHQYRCGIPCYWPKMTPKSQASNQSFYSHSLSRKKRASIFCGSQALYHRNRQKSAVSKGKRIASKTAQGILPLLTDGSRCSSDGSSEDDLSSRFGELYLERLSRLDGRRWSTSCRSLEVLEKQSSSTGEEGTPENSGSLSLKYRPMFFNELTGQYNVVQSLCNAISTGRTAPVYLFQGPRGTGKSSAARIFASGLNCTESDDTKPCGVCEECMDFMSCRNNSLLEIDGTNRKAILGVRHILRHLSVKEQSPLAQYKVLVVDECHLLPSRIWMAFLKFFEEPPPRVLFIFITTEHDNVPHSILSLCQKYSFNKIKDCDIVERLRKISEGENLDVESDALNLIASIADGSLRDAETMLDQLTLLGKRITKSLVNELVGTISDDKLMELLDLAIASNTTGTVKKARELMDSGVDPLVLMSQLANLITDLIAGTYHANNFKINSRFSGEQTLNTIRTGKLKRALIILSEAEKQLRVASERSTWFTATLLQLGSGPPSELSQSSNSKLLSSRTTDEVQSRSSIDLSCKQRRHDSLHAPTKSVYSLSPPCKQNYSHQREFPSNAINSGFNSVHNHKLQKSAGSAALPCDGADENCINPDEMSGIWDLCVEGCHSKTLKQLLHAHGMLASISNLDGVLVAFVAFEDASIKSRAERYLSSITDSIETIFRCNVEVRMILSDEACRISPNSRYYMDVKQGESPQPTIGGNSTRTKGDLKTDSVQKRVCTPGENMDAMEQRARSTSFLSLVDEAPESCGQTPAVFSRKSTEINETKERNPDIPMQRIESIIREQRLETAWLQSVGKGAPGSVRHLMSQEGHMLQDIENHQNQIHSLNHAEEELTHEMTALNDSKSPQNASTRRDGYRPASPSLLHNGHLSKDLMGYDSASGGRGCSCFLCWNRSKKGKVKVKRRISEGRRLSWFRRCLRRRH